MLAHPVPNLHILEQRHMESTVTNIDTAAVAAGRGAITAGVVGRPSSGQLRGRLVVVERVTKFAAFLRELPEQRDVDGEDVVISSSTPRATATSPYVELDAVDPLTLSATNRAFLTQLTGGDYGPVEQAVEATRAAGRAAATSTRPPAAARQKPAKHVEAASAAPDAQNPAGGPSSLPDSTSDEPADNEPRGDEPARRKPSSTRTRMPKDVKFLTAEVPTESRRLIVWNAAREIQPATRDQIVDRACQDPTFQKKSSKNMASWYVKQMVEEGALRPVENVEQS